MSSGCHSTAVYYARSLCVLGAVWWHCAGAAAAVQVCVDSASATSGMDTQLARAVAKSTQTDVQVKPFVGYGKGGDGLPPGRFAKMAQGDCDLIMGFPVDRSSPHLPPDVQATVPYAATGFALIERRHDRHAPATLDQFPAGSEVGIAQLNTYAGLLYTGHRNLTMHVYADDDEMLRDLRAGHLAAALGWQPAIEAAAARHHQQSALRVTLLSEKHMQWDLVALYADRSSPAAATFEKGMMQLRQSGSLARLVAPYDVPAFEAAKGVRQVDARPALHTAVWTDAADDGARHASDAPARWIAVSDRSAAPAGASKHRAGPPALYTGEQAKQGFMAYETNCGMCHGPLLTGQVDGYPGPALKGADFADPSYDFHVNEIFNFVAKLMPPGKPGSLPPDQDVLIMSYILQQNGYPAGEHELTYDEAAHSKTPIRYYGAPK
jgi:polar amino acid transport system substrate-binding protein